MILLLPLCLAALAPETTAFTSARYGLAATLPESWTVAQREEDDRVFVALIPQSDPQRPGVAACELALAPESLDDYRTRLDANAKRDRRPGSTLVKNEVVKAPDGDRLETLREFRPGFGGVWRELTVRRVANRQMYAFILNVDEDAYVTARPAFDAMVASVKFTKPDTGAVAEDGNRWLQREFKFAIELPDGWSPVLAPSEVALFYANGPAHAIWSDNVLILAHPHRATDLEAMAKSFPEELRQADPNCEVISCAVVKQGTVDALETVVRTTRGPFSMTVLERRFKGDRFDYEVKFTVESKRYDALAPALRKSLESFRERPGVVPKGGASKSA